MKGFLCAALVLTSLGAFACRAETPPEPARESNQAQTREEPGRIAAEDIAEVLRDSNVVLLDVRRPDEIEELGTLEGYLHIPIEELESRLDELPKDKAILTA